MTIGTTISSIVAEGNGSNTNFPFPFLVPAASDLVVTYIDADGVETVLTGTQYSVAPNGFDNPSGGTVVYPLSGSPIAAGTNLLIERTLPVIQTVSVSNQGPTFTAIEDGLDYLTMLIQQQNSTIDRAIVGNPSDPAGLNYVLPPVAQRALQTLFFDSAGNVTVGGSASTYVSTAMAPVVAAATIAEGANLLLADPIAGVNVSGSPLFNIGTPVGQGTTSVTSFAAVGIYATSSVAHASSSDEFGLAIGFVTNTGDYGTDSVSRNRVALYSAIDAFAGAGNIWAGKFVTVLRPGACLDNASQILELDFSNQSGVDFGSNIVSAGLIQPAAIGVQVTGNGTNANSAAITVLGNSSSVTLGLWNAGYYVGIDNVNLVGLFDEGRSFGGTGRIGVLQKQYFDIGLSLQGIYSGYGLDMYTASVTANAAMRLRAGHQILARTSLDDDNVELLQTNATTNSLSIYYAALYLGDNPGSPSSAVNSFVLTSGKIGFAPANTGVQVCGSSTNMWSAVWATNGTIQTSDPTLKTDIKPISAVDTGAIIDAIQPIAFRWVDGGGGRPGRRQHWGWNAAEVQDAFEQLGEDFGGFVRADDGSLHLRPDQMLPILWQEVRNLRQPQARSTA